MSRAKLDYIGAITCLIASGMNLYHANVLIGLVLLLIGIMLLPRGPA